jgi:flagellar hook-length control protein FliK
MMPAITLTLLPAVPPFQFLPEADLNFDAVFATLAPPAQQTPTVAVGERAMPDETVLPFLGSNPVKAQLPTEQASLAKEETLDTLKDALPEPQPVPPPILPLAPLISQAVQNTPASSPPLFRLAIGAKPSLPVSGGEEESTSTSSVRTELSAVPSTITQLNLSDVREPTPPQPIASTPTADPLRFVVERQLDLARDSRWLDALTRDIVAVADTPDRLSFRLSPPQLGRLDVDLSTSDSGLSVRMNTSTEAAAQIVAAAQPRLIDDLKSQGVRVAEAQVSTGGGQSHGQGQQQQREADQMIEFARARFEQANDSNPMRPDGRFA